MVANTCYCCITVGLMYVCVAPGRFFVVTKTCFLKFPKRKGKRERMTTHDFELDIV